MALACRTLPRRALTLLEVLLVLALLVVMASVVWPALEPVLAGMELRKSADRVRVEWNRARVDALASGRTILFRYSTESNRYSIEQCPEPRFVASDGSSPTSDSPTGTPQSSSEPPTREDVLPERIKFLRSEISDDELETQETSTAATTAGKDNWSDPIVFYPDGTTSDARLTLKNERGQCIELSLRGLTGVVSIGEVFAEGEAGA